MKHLSRVLVVLGIGGLLSAPGTLAGQSKAELRRKYGAPISEAFIVRPGITATATYGTGGRIIEWLISPRITDLEKSGGRTLSYEAVKAVIDELVPPSVRGKQLGTGIRDVTCLPANDCDGSDQVYQNLRIYYNHGIAGLSYVVVQWNVGMDRGR